MPPSNGVDRLDRIEATLETLTANVDRLARAMLGLPEHAERADQRMGALAEAQRQTEERLNALIAVIDDIVRRNPLPQRLS